MDPKNERQALLAALASQQKVIASQGEQISSLRKGIEMIAHYAGLSKKVALVMTADQDNPAQPVPNPASAAPVETTEEALAPHAVDDPRALGATPGANDGVAADATTTVMTPGADIPTPPFNQLVDVTAPVAGTETHIPEQQTRIETDVRVGNPDNPEFAFPLTPAFSGEAGESGNGPAIHSTGTRMLASLKLARLRKAAGIENGDELEIAGRIEAEASLTDEAIATEINVLSNVAKAAAKRAPQGGPRPRTAGVQRTLPSLQSEPVQRTASAVPVSAETEDSDLFLDF